MIMPLQPNVETFIGCDAAYEDASIVLFGAPFDSTTSFRPGARFGPAAMRHESFGLETYSPYQDADLTDCSVFDSGTSNCASAARSRPCATLSSGRRPSSPTASCPCSSAGSIW